MLGRARVRAALAGSPVERPAVFYHFLGGAHHVLDAMQKTMPEIYESADHIASAQFTAAEMFGHDTTMAPWGCLTVEAEAFGCTLEHYDQYYPQTRSRPLAHSKDLNRLRTISAENLGGRMPTMVEALGRLRVRGGDDLFVVGMVVSPFLVACELRDMSALMLDMGIDPPFVHDLLSVITDGLGNYVTAMIKSGACDAVMFENAAMTTELLGPHHVAEFIRPYHRQLVATARSADPDVILIEHNCGATPYYREIQSTDIDVVSFATQDIAKALGPANANQPPKAGIGVLDHAELLLRGTSQQVYDEATRCLQRAGSRSFALSTGCEIPFKAPLANIEAIALAAQQFDPNELN